MRTNTLNKTGIIKHTFTDEDGDIFASCRINPTDVRLMKRAEEVSEFFKNNKPSDNMTSDELLEFNDILEDKICYLLGYDAKQDLFGLMPGLSVNQEGEMWAMVVLDTINEHITPEIKKRQEKITASIDKYTEKYTK